MGKENIVSGPIGTKMKKPHTLGAGLFVCAEGEGFEPSIPLGGIPVFETGRFNHSRTLPCG
jgi:hypothetical protein